MPNAHPVVPRRMRPCRYIRLRSTLRGRTWQRARIRERFQQRCEDLAIASRLMSRGEVPHREAQRGELGLDRIELAAIVELAAQRVADVMHAARGAVGDL